VPTGAGSVHNFRIREPRLAAPPTTPQLISVSDLTTAARRKTKPLAILDARISGLLLTVILAIDADGTVWT
jgi:hypothetical protein